MRPRITGPRHRRITPGSLNPHEVEAASKDRDSYSYRPLRVTLWKKIFGA